MPSPVLSRIAPLLILITGLYSLAGHAATPAAQSAGPPASPAARSGDSPASAAPAAKSNAVAPAPANDAAGASIAPMSAAQVVELLDQTIGWYRTLGVQQQAANEPSDLLILYDNRQTAARVVALAFEIARTDADMLAMQPAAVNAADADTQNLTQLQSKFTQQASAVQAELQSNRRKLETASRKQAGEIKSKIAELQGELDLLNARKTLLATLASITRDSSSANSAGPAALKSQIDAMAVAVPTQAPASVTTPAAPAAGAATPNAGAPLTPTTAQPSINVSASYGLWDLAANVFKLSEKLTTVDGLDTRTAVLQKAFSELRNPLVEQLKALSSRGDALAQKADSADATALDQTRAALDSLVEQFKQASALLIPLGKEEVLLSQYRRTLQNWHNLVRTQYRGALKTLGVRLGIVLAMLAVVFLAAELWRRAVNRYVHDTRRRYQFLLLRKIALWCVVVLIVGFAFASELTSIVTFAGLITAGLAVAMQSVLVSIVGYFFLIGKYGIRVGDRVQIGDVAGEVIDLGLVRLHLMELGPHGQGVPTGRVVAFANSIVFQVAGGLFKQIPGVNFAWHERTLPLPAGIDYTQAKEKLLAAVRSALKDSMVVIARQTQELQRTTASSAEVDDQPRVQLNYTTGGVEALIRYPVHLRNAEELDERVSEEVLRTIGTLTPNRAVAHPT